METTSLGPLTVTRLCLGTMLMGGKTPVKESHQMLDRYLEAGGNFLDTADVYGDGESERTLAPWLAQHRDEVVVATKVRMPVSDPPGEGLAPDRIRAACDASLKRLGIDVIDLYQVHAPDPETPLEETLEALDGLVKAGKVRALGASNFPAWLLAWAVATQDREGWSPFISLQPQYSLVERSAERSTSEYCGCSEMNGDQPSRSCVATAHASSQAGKFEAPSARTLPAFTSPSSASSVSSSGVSGSGACTW